VARPGGVRRLTAPDRGAAVLVLVADDHALVRHGLIGLLQHTFATWSFLQADGLAPAMRQLDERAAEVGLLVIDLVMPGMNGADSIRLLRQTYPDLPIAVLTGIEMRATMQSCLAAGAQGYLRKSQPPDQLVHAIGALAAGSGHRPATSRLPTADLPPPDAPADLAMAGLTGRQQDVLRLLVDGRSTKEIARRLNLGLGTVKVHLNGVYQRLGARSRTEAVACFRARQTAGG
jgi:DNA-binding NarL/FixJ family response regulator